MKKILNAPAAYVDEMLAGLCLANLKSTALDKRRMSIERELEAARAAQRSAATV